MEHFTNLRKVLFVEHDLGHGVLLVGYAILMGKTETQRERESYAPYLPPAPVQELQPPLAGLETK